MFQSSPATIMEILLDEIDWPELGYFSGFMNSSYPDLINVFWLFYKYQQKFIANKII